MNSAQNSIEPHEVSEKSPRICAQIHVGSSKNRLLAISIVVLTIILFTGLTAQGEEKSSNGAAIRHEIKKLKDLISGIEEKSVRDTKRQQQEFEMLRNDYESRISELNEKITRIEAGEAISGEPVGVAETLRRIRDNSFNPSIGVILNGKFSDYSETDSEMLGFGIGEEGERGRESLAIDESELNFSANIDDKFYGSLTAAIVREEGSDIVELEEAYVQTLPDFGLPNGLTLKAGRAFWILGYLNEHHSHADDFADRPLPYRAYLNKSFNDDGVEVSYVLPTGLFTEIGGGAFRGEDFPGGNPTGSSPQSYSAFFRVGGDFGDNHSWRLGGYWLGANANERTSNEDTVTFSGDSDLYGADLRYTWAPTGNANTSEVILQAEFFQRDEDGFYDDTNIGTGFVAFDDNTSGWYVQGVYKFHPQWRIGVRYSELQSMDTPVGLVGSAIDPAGHNPDNLSVMVDWTNSEFSRLRLQYSHEKLSRGGEDDQLILQYIVSFGAHGAHKF